MIDLEKEDLHKKFIDINPLTIDSELLQLSNNMINWSLEDIKNEYKIFKEDQEKKLQAKRRKEIRDKEKKTKIELLLKDILRK